MISYDVPFKVMLYIVKYGEHSASVFERSDTALKFLEKIRETVPDAEMVCTDEIIHTTGGGAIDASQYHGESNRVWTGLNGKQARKYRKKMRGAKDEKLVWKARERCATR